MEKVILLFMKLKIFAPKKYIYTVEIKGFPLFAKSSIASLRYQSERSRCPSSFLFVMLGSNIQTVLTVIETF